MATTTEDLSERTDEAEAPPATVPPDASGGAGGGGEGADAVPEPDQATLRIAVAVAFPVIAASVMVGGTFIGFSPRIYAGVAGLLGVALAVGVGRVRQALLANVLIVAGIFVIGLLMVVPNDPGAISSIQTLASRAASSGDVLRPPVDFTAGWQAIVGWLMACVGFAAAWVALTFRRPALALLLPLPVAAIAGISVPKADQVASGISVLALFAVGLGLLSGAQAVGDDDTRPPLAYELRRAAKSIPLIAVITFALYLLSQTNFLFPDPYIDPTQEPQRPRTTPLSSVEDRVLFEVESTITGPWRIGTLDVYDGRDWRLPPFAESLLNEVPKDGIVDDELSPGVRARFSIAGLTGAVLPGLPNMVGIVAEGPRLSYDPRNGNIRTAQGQVQAGLNYTVTAAGLPSVVDLARVTAPIPPALRRFTRISPAPPAVVALLEQAKEAGPDKWSQFDFLRTYVLDNVTAVGVGSPKSVTPERAQEMLSSNKEGSPFEIVALQAMLARWAGIPSRIGYGFDGGEQVGNKMQVRPRNGATFPEVYFPGYKWLPVIGTPKQARPSVNTDPSQQQFDPTVLPSNDISVQVFMPVIEPPESVFGEQVRRVVFVVLGILLLVALLYLIYPAVRKAIVRARRRSRADSADARSQVALAYAEWRDYATDFGYSFPNDTPLMYLDRFVEDPEHTELAWLVTRALWGDLQDELTPAHVAAARELSRALRRRLASSQPLTVRVVALFSRLSLRKPFAPDLNSVLGGKEPARAAVA